MHDYPRAPGMDAHILKAHLPRLNRPVCLLEAAAALNRILESTRPALLWAGRVLFVVLAIANATIILRAGAEVSPWATVIAGPLLWGASLWSLASLFVCTGASVLTGRWGTGVSIIVAVATGHLLTAGLLAEPSDVPLSVPAATLASLLAVSLLGGPSRLGADVARDLRP